MGPYICCPGISLGNQNSRRIELRGPKYSLVYHIDCYGLLQKYFGEMDSGKDYRPITNNEMKQTSVYRIKIDHWSGKRNWPERADQAEEGEWPDLDPKWFEFY